MTARPFVELTIPPREGELDSWRKDPRGQWWGLVTWYEDVVQLKQMGRSTVLPCSGWVAARHLRVRAREDYTAVPRVDLPEELKGFEPLTPRCDDTRRVQIAVQARWRPPSHTGAHPIMFKGNSSNKIPS